MPAQLRVTVANAACSKVLVNFRRGKSASPENIVPLYPSERLVLALPPLNVNVLFQDIWPLEGKAVLRIDYATDLSDERNAGIVSSADFSITFNSPAPGETAEYRDALTHCIDTNQSQCLNQVAFFAAVRDSRGADLLVRLLRQHPYSFFVAPLRRFVSSGCGSASTKPLNKACEATTSSSRTWRHLLEAVFR
jgi:hypothetical protein